MLGDQLTMDELLEVDPVELVRAARLRTVRERDSITGFIDTLERDLARARRDLVDASARLDVLDATINTIGVASPEAATEVAAAPEGATLPAAELDLPAKAADQPVRSWERWSGTGHAPSSRAKIAAAQQARAAKRAVCSKCGREFSLAGLGPHQAACKATAPATPPRSSSPIPALRAWSGKPESTVRAWLKRINTLGLVPVDRAHVPRPVPDPPPVAPKMPPLDDIAAAYKDAATANRRPISALADRFDAPRDVVQEWVGLARAAGLLPPRDEPQVPGVLPDHRAVPRIAGSLL